jgi:dTDP-4-dehydrorhamnose reductase
MRYLLVGAAGQLGSAFHTRLKADGAEVVAWTRREVDLADSAAIGPAVEAVTPDIILNCAAYNHVDRAEDDAPGALAVNAFAVHDLARAAVATGARLVHYSTDFVFDGFGSVPYGETDPTNPLSVYGQSKLVGEWLALEAPSSLVLRVESLFGGPASHSSIDRIVSSLKAGEPPRVFVDRVVSPSYVEDVVEATLQLLKSDAEGGVYHCVNSGHTTWHELAQWIAARLGVTTGLVPVKVADAQMRAPRPQYCALSSAKLSAAGVVMPPWEDAIARHLPAPSGTP